MLIYFINKRIEKTDELTCLIYLKGGLILHLLFEFLIYKIVAGLFTRMRHNNIIDIIIKS